MAPVALPDTHESWPPLLIGGGYPRPVSPASLAILVDCRIQVIHVKFSLAESLTKTGWQPSNRLSSFLPFHFHETTQTLGGHPSNNQRRGASVVTQNADDFKLFDGVSVDTY